MARCFSPGKEVMVHSGEDLYQAEEFSLKVLFMTDVKRDRKIHHRLVAASAGMWRWGGS